MEKINLVELLRNCPSGMELDCALVENLYFDCINDSELDDPYPIQCYTQNGSYRTSIRFTEYGHFTFFDNSKCVIFPKGKTTWEGFVSPCKFKDGDILFVDCSDDNDKNHQYIFMLNRIYNSEVHSYCHYRMCGVFHPKTEYLTGNEFPIRLATKEEKEKLFDAIKANGYKWNPETKTLEKLSEPKFKDGDIVAFGSSRRGTQLFIFKKYINNDDNYAQCYMMLDCDGDIDFESGRYYVERLATEEEKQKLFQAIKDNGYKWNAETKTLEKLGEQKLKNGDVIVCENHWGPFISIFKENVIERNGFIGHCVFDVDDNEFKVKDSASYFNKVRFATKREKEQLFQAIKDNGYKWNPDNKTLEKVEPKFKVGNKVRVKNGVSESRIIDGVFDTFYSLQMFGKIDFTDQDRWELVHDKFDLNTLVPFESRVLVRNDKDQYWIPAFWGGKRTDGYTTTFGWSKYCIPFNGNEHLLDSNKNCDKFYRTWEKNGD